MNSKIRDENVDELLQAILTIQDLEECYNFFEDLCTATELKAISQRFIVAKMLHQHKVYSEIVAKTGASTATISRVNRSLTYGSDGYNTVLSRLAQKEKTAK